MKHFYTQLGAAAIAGACLMGQPALGYLIPIASIHENRNPNLQLLIESEITRWKQEALKYKELLHTDMLGKAGGGSLGKNNVITEMKEASEDGTSSISNTETKLDKVTNLTDYNSTKTELEKNYIIQAKKGLEYSTPEMAVIEENQRKAINDLATSGIAMAAVETVGVGIDMEKSKPEKRSDDLAKAKDAGAMYEMLLGLDRRIYERSLRISALEATDAELKAMQTLQGLSRTAHTQIDSKSK